MIDLKPTKFDAIVELVGGGISGAEDGTLMEYRGKTPPSEAEIDAKLKEMVAEHDAQEYARNRSSGTWETYKDKTETVTNEMGDEVEKISQVVDKEAIAVYPPIGDQLDDLYKRGAFSDDMAAKLKKVKDSFPKPS